MRTPLAALAALALAAPAPAKVVLNPLFSDGAVLQAGKPVRVFGTAAPGTDVTVKLSFGDGSTVTVPANKDGSFLAELPALPVVAKPGTIAVSDKDGTVTVQNVLVGEVWVCSGQSNMEWPMAATHEPESAIRDSASPQIRLYQVPHIMVTEPAATVPGVFWKPCEPRTVAGFTAVGYYFGKELHRAKGVPIGLIQSAWGGTVAEAWTSRAALEAEPSLKYLADKTSPAGLAEAAKKANTGFLKKLEEYAAANRAAAESGKQLPPVPVPPRVGPGGPNDGGCLLYNGMIHPIENYSVRGAIWYQGESNAGSKERAYEYRTLFPTMITDWRRAFRDPEMPFLLVQLAPFMKIEKQPSDTPWAALREAQLFSTQKLPNVAVAVITDVGDEADIHPRKKKPAAERLALAARALAYGEKIPYRGPTFDKLRVEGNTAVVTFAHADGGLVAKGGELTGFTVAGEDGKFYNAKAEIKGNAVSVSAPEVAAPKAVRFGWANYPVVNLWNGAGLPASPFRTDAPEVTGQKPEPAAKPAGRKTGR